MGNPMKNTKVNMFGAMGSVPENSGKVNDFEQAERDFETAHAGGDDSTALLIAYRALNNAR